MNRSNFLKTLGITVASAPMIGALKIEGMSFENGIEKVVVEQPSTAKIAIDVQAISNVGIEQGGKRWSAKEVLELYNETGILLFRRTPDMGDNYQPITVIDK